MSRNGSKKPSEDFDHLLANIVERLDELSAKTHHAKNNSGIKDDGLLMTLIQHVTGQTDANSERLEKLQANIFNELQSMNSTLVRNTIILDEHQKRTTNLENVVKPISTHVAVVGGIAKIVAGLGILGGTIITILKIFETFKDIQ